MITNFLFLFKKSPLLAFINVGSNFMLNSKRLEISPKNGWRARVAGEPMTSFPNWRCLLVKIRTFFDENPDCEF
jgi:hypothetical protein